MSRLKGKSKSKYRKQMRLIDLHQRESYKKKTLDKILKFEDPMLKTVCEPVAENENIENIKKDMGRVLHYSKGAGIAANQIGIVKSIILVLLDKKNLTFLINPEIIEKSEDEIIDSQEGCLSFPNVVGIVKRYKRIKLKYEDEKRVIQEKEFEDYNSIVVQHEISHILGECDLYKVWKEQMEENNKKSSTSAAINKECKDGD